MANQLRHLAIIMDGNGRWAQSQGKRRIYGHKKGANTLRNITIFCAENAIEFLTLYAFSTENWSRPKNEVEFLMKLLGQYLEKEQEHYLKNNIRFRAIGDLSVFSNPLQRSIAHLENLTQTCSGLTQVLALNYGSRNEIIRMCQKLLKNPHLQKIDELLINSNLDTHDMPEVDMLIRTGGEMRLSNFLLWQSAYAELFFTPTFWPSFTTTELEGLIQEFHSRSRRFGGI